MILFSFTSKDKNKLQQLTYNLCDGYVGWEEFVNNNVVVSNPELLDDNETYRLNMVIGPDNDNDLEVEINIDATDDVLKYAKK